MLPHGGIVLGSPTMICHWRIKRIAADGNTADEDYFLFAVGETSGFLTINANDDSSTSKKDADTKGTLYGAMGEGPNDGNAGRGRLRRTRVAAPATISSLPSRSRRITIIW